MVRSVCRCLGLDRGLNHASRVFLFLCCTDEDFETAVRNLKGKLYPDGADGASDHGRLLW